MLYLVLLMVFVHFGVFFYYAAKLNGGVEERELINRS